MVPQQGKAFGVQVQLLDVKHTLINDGLVMNLKWRFQNPNLTQPSQSVQQKEGLAVGSILLWSPSSGDALSE